MRNLNKLTFENNIPFRDGRALCSLRNPRREAQQWVERQRPDPSCETLVLGIGAGFHLDQLKLTYPAMKITGLDFNSGAEVTPVASAEAPEAPTWPLVNGWKAIILPPEVDATEIWHSIVKPRLANDFQVLRFHPSWAACEASFQDLEDVLLGQNLKNGDLIPWLAEDEGVRKWCHEVSPELALSLRSLMDDQITGRDPVPGARSPGRWSSRQKVFLAMRELIA
ncbi:MAG: hypothetical protein C5B49_12680 [Bdellovibrio sp.]|nr:MAG: hypothetical protein C5B49_12680 [Bdellovibrio sp.]